MNHTTRMIAAIAVLSVASLSLAPTALAWFPTAAECDGVHVVPEHPDHGVYDQLCVGAFQGLGESCSGVWAAPHVNFDDEPGDEPELWTASVCVGDSSECRSDVNVFVRKDGAGGPRQCVDVA